MMNSYFDHSSGFYNPAAAEAHQAAYRSFSQSLSLAAPQSAYQATSRTSSSSADNSSSTYVDAACKLYDSSPLPGSSQQGPPPPPPPTSLGAKEQNGFKAPDQMSAWNSAATLRPSPATGASMTGGFDASRSMSDAWSACCQPTAGGPAAATSSFYPWMAIAGQLRLPFLSSCPVASRSSHSRDTLFVITRIVKGLFMRHHHSYHSFAGPGIRSPFYPPDTPYIVMSSFRVFSFCCC